MGGKPAYLSVCPVNNCPAMKITRLTRAIASLFNNLPNNIFNPREDEEWWSCIIHVDLDPKVIPLKLFLDHCWPGEFRNTCSYINPVTVTQTFYNSVRLEVCRSFHSRFRLE